MTNNARTAQELAKLQENAANYAAWCDGYSAEAKGHGNDSSAMHYEGMAFVLRQLAALASQADQSEDGRDAGLLEALKVLYAEYMRLRGCFPPPYSAGYREVRAAKTAIDAAIAAKEQS